MSRSARDESADKAAHSKWLRRARMSKLQCGDVAAKGKVAACPVSHSLADLPAAEPPECVAQGVDGSSGRLIVPRVI